MDISQTLTIAAEIQQSLLPESYPRLSHFDLAAISIPVDKVGGDFYDFIKLGEDRLGILIGDATGHGLSAAIFMAAAKSQLLYEAKRILSPATVMTAAHSRVVNFFASQSKFATVTYGILFQRDRQFMVTTAGMMPYWVRTKRAECLELQSPGATFPLGSRLMRGEYESRKIALSFEDILVFYSDGLVEAENQQEELFGYQRLADLLLSHRKDTAFGVVNALITAMTDFTNAAPLDDDLTLVVLKAAPPPDIPTVAKRSTIQGERKPVAVMICHVVEKSGGTVDVQKVFSSAGNSLQDASLLATLHDTYGGIFEPLSESTLVGLFGVPQTYEDNVQRALAAAWELKARLAEANLSMQSGIHTGTVIFRPDAAIDYSLMGNTFNHALQLSHHSPEGQILLSEQAHQLARGDFEVETTDIREIDLGTVLAVKKKAVIPLQRRETALVGRTSELASLHQCLNRLTEGQGQVVSIIGEAGIGKSRLVTELKTYIEGQGANWVQGRCASIGQPISYRPFLDILRTYFNLGEKDSDKEMALKVTESVTNLCPQSAKDFLPILGNLLSIKFGNELDDKLISATPEQIRHQTLIRLREFFGILSKQQPLMLVLEDLHWSDELSLDLLSLLMDELATIPLMLLCTYRPEKERRISQLSSQAQRKCLDRYTEIQLQPLSSLQSRQLLEELLQIKNLSENIKDLILQKSEGNPFFIEEVIRSLREQDLVSQDKEHFKALPEIASIDVPDTIQNIVLARVDRLPTGAKHILQYASVIGRLFKYRLLQHLTQQERHLDGYLNELEECELIYKERTIPELEYAFGHVLTQEATYQSLLERQQRELHHRVASGIEMLYQEHLEKYYEELAHHYSKTDNKSKAVEYQFKAGEKARGMYANQEAISYFEKALEFLLSQPKDEKQVSLEMTARELLGDVLFTTGAHQEAEVQFKHALNLTSNQQDMRHIASLTCKLADAVHWQGDYDRAIEMAESGLTALEGQTRGLETANLLEVIGRSYHSKRDLESARRYANQIAQIIRQIPYFDTIYKLYYWIAWVEIGAGNFQTAIEWLEELERICLAHDNEVGLARCYHGLGDLWRYQNDFQQASQWLEKSLGYCERIGEAHLLLEGHLELAYLLILLDGEPSQIETNIQRGMEVADQMKSTSHVASASALCKMLGDAYLQKGDNKQALFYFHRGIEFGPPTPFLSSLLCGLNQLYIQQGQHEKFFDFCQQAQQKTLFQSQTSLRYWHLQPASPSTDYSQLTWLDSFDGASLREEWRWIDPQRRSSYDFVRQGVLELRTPSGQDLSSTNTSAPRLLRQISGDFAVETRLVDIKEGECQIGGLLLWSSEEIHLSFGKRLYPFEKRLSLINEVLLEVWQRSQGGIVGRGWLPGRQLYLRLERNGKSVSVLCSNDGKKWQSCGETSFPADNPVWIGLYVACPIRLPGSVVRFKEFKLFQQEVR